MNKHIDRDLCTEYDVIGPTLVIHLGGRRRVLSSAPQGGGLTRASYILNHHVDPHSDTNGHYPDPADDLRKLAAQLGLTGGTVGLMTAVPMTRLVTARAASDEIWVECFATVGVTNAVRAGEWPQHPAPQSKAMKPGTINLMLITNVCLSSSAMIGVVQVVTEAKTGVLHDQAVPSHHGTSIATGTGTDAVVIAGRLRGRALPTFMAGRTP
ncbi:MAG: adenosylcobinamide amidohydrolase [Nitrospira sp.]